MYWCCCYCFLIGAYRAKAFTPKCCTVVIIVAGACLQAKQSVLHCYVRLQHVVSILADGYGWLVVGCYNSSSFSFVFVVGLRWNFYEWKLFYVVAVVTSVLCLLSSFAGRITLLIDIRCCCCWPVQNIFYLSHAIDFLFLSLLKQVHVYYSAVACWPAFVY